MSELQNAAFTIIGLYFLLLVGVGLWLARKESRQDFIIGSRQVGTIPTVASLAASFRDGGGVALWITAGLTVGYGYMWLLLGVMVTVFMYNFIGSALRKEAIERNYVTIGQVVADRIGPFAEKTSSFVSLVFTFLLIALQFNVSGSMFAEILHIPAWQGVAMMCAVLMLYLVIGGYKSVVITDTLQVFFIVSLAVIPFLVPPALQDMTDVGSVLNASVSDAIALFLIGFFLIVNLPEAWQKVFSARNDGVIKAAFPLTGLLLTFMTLTLVWLGMGLKTHMPDIDPEKAYIAMFSHPDLLSPWVLGYISMVILAVTMSCGSANTYAFISTLGKNFFGQSLAKSEKDYVLFARAAMVVTLVLTATLSLFIDDVVQYMFDIISIVYILTPIYLIAALVRPKKSAFLDKGLSGAVVLTGLVYIYIYATGFLQQELIHAMLPALLSIVLCLIVLLIAKKRGKA